MDPTTQRKARRAAIGARIRALRHARGLSLHRLEDLSGINRRSISNYEHGTRGASAERLAVIARALGAALADILPPAAAEPPCEPPAPPILMPDLPSAFVASRDGQAMLSAFGRTADPWMRAKIVEIATSLAGAA